jgi:hypothetical protein
MWVVALRCLHGWGVVEKVRELVMEMRFLRGKLEEEVWRGRSRRLGVGCRAAATF